MQKFDVIIPVKSTNRLFLNNIASLAEFQEVESIIIGDAGLAEDTRDSVRYMPKVNLISHAHFKSQGACIIDLVQRVSTSCFVYLHGDVTLPEGWFYEMYRGLSEADFVECGRHYEYEISHFDYSMDRVFPKARPLSGAQMGKRDFFLRASEKVDDDFLFRNEDLIFADLIEQIGGTYSIVNTTHHTHQIGFKRENENIDGSVSLKLVRRPSNSAKDRDIFLCQIRGLLKYTSGGHSYLRDNVLYSKLVLDSFGENTRFKCLMEGHPISWRWRIYEYLIPLSLLWLRARFVYKALRVPNQRLFES